MKNGKCNGVCNFCRFNCSHITYVSSKPKVEKVDKEKESIKEENTNLPVIVEETFDNNSKNLPVLLNDEIITEREPKKKKSIIGKILGR